MNIEQSKTLHSIAQALLVLASADSAAGQAYSNQDSMHTEGLARDNYALGSIRGANATKTEARETEIEREMYRLMRANESLQSATDLLWTRTNTVTSPPAPTGDTKGTAIESCGSQLGGAIQAQALRTESVASSLRYLVESLAV